MIIYGISVPANILTNSDDCIRTIGLTGEIYSDAFIRIIDWTVSAKIQPCITPLNDTRGMLFFCKSASAMAKGFRKIFDSKGSNPQYMLDGGNESIGLVFGSYDRDPGTTRVGAGVRIVGHNVSQAGKRAIGKSIMSIKYLMLKLTDKSSNERSASLQKTASKLSSNLNFDHYQNFSAINNVINEFQSGFYLFVARTKFLPNNIQNASSVRLIGMTADFGLLANNITRDNRQELRTGMIGN